MRTNRSESGKWQKHRSAISLRNKIWIQKKKKTNNSIRNGTFVYRFECFSLFFYSRKWKHFNSVHLNATYISTALLGWNSHRNSFRRLREKKKATGWNIGKKRHQQTRFLYVTLVLVMFWYSHHAPQYMCTNNIKDKRRKEFGKDFVFYFVIDDIERWSANARKSVFVSIGWLSMLCG